jgi:hypothetical protein
VTCVWPGTGTSPGANVKASYEEKDGNKVATSFMVMPAR